MPHIPTTHQNNHVAEVFEILKRAYLAGSPWVHGRTFATVVETRNLSARIGDLRHHGYAVESRSASDGEGWSEYRLLSLTPGEPPGRSWLRVRLPAGRWAESDVKALQEAAEEAVRALAAELASRRPTPTALATDPSLSTDEFIDQLLGLMGQE